MVGFLINPVFGRHRAEAEFVGHILSSFGEIEVQTCINTGNIHKLFNPIMSTLYAIKVTSTRIETALRLTRPAAEHHGLTSEFELVAPMIWHCAKIRNQYAHCNWADHPSEEGVFFADLQDAANEENFYLYWKFIDLPLLQRQLDYFNTTMEQLNFLAGEIMIKTSAPSQISFPKPIIPTPPPLHNPPHEHVPQWLDEAGKRLHSAKSLAARRTPDTNTGTVEIGSAAPEKRLWQEEQRRKSREGEQNAKERSGPLPENQN